MIRINLLAAERPAAKAPTAPGAMQLYVLLAAFAGGALAVCAFAWWLKSSQIAELDDQIAAANARKQQLEAVAKQVKELEQKRKTFQDKVKLIEELKGQQGSAMYMLTEVSKALPDFVWLQNMQQSGNKINFKGQSATLTSIADFITNLQNAGDNCGKPDPEKREGCWFPEVNLVNSQQSNNVVNFDLSASFQTPREPAPAAGQPGAAAKPGAPAAGAPAAR